MIMSEIIAQAYSVGFLVTGISHALHPGMWSKFFLEMRKSETAPFTIGVLTLPIGLLIVLGHNIWRPDITILITIFGWLMTFKSVVYLVFPASFRKVTPDSLTTGTKGFRWIGLAMTMIGMALVFRVFFLRTV